MASNFRILVHRNSDSLHLKLVGDFDGSSACVLFNTLARNWDDWNKIFVHTKDIKDVHPFSRDLFQGNLRKLNERRTNLCFTGENGPRIAPGYSISE